MTAAMAARQLSISNEENTADAVLDDRDVIAEDEAVVLIVEDDPRFASILLTLAHEPSSRASSRARAAR
jgi:hypothetical protein